MGLGSLIDDVKNLRLALKARSRLKEEIAMKGAWAALYAIFGFIGTGIVARLTMDCPDLAAAIGPAALAALGGAVTFYLNRPKTSAAGKSLLAGALAAGWAAFQAQVTTVCGAGFVEQLPTLVTAGAVVGLGLYLRSPKWPSAPSIDPKRFVTGLVALAALVGLTACGSLAQVRVGGEAKPAGPDQKVVEGLVCQARDKDAEVYLGDRGASRAEITERIERARQDTAGRPGCACRETTCVGLKPAK
jgi:hypothetical protein